LIVTKKVQNRNKTVILAYHNQLFWNNSLFVYLFEIFRSL
jgi:hypothetical protein